MDGHITPLRSESAIRDCLEYCLGEGLAIEDMFAAAATVRAEHRGESELTVVRLGAGTLDIGQLGTNVVIGVSASGSAAGLVRTHDFESLHPDVAHEHASSIVMRALAGSEGGAFGTKPEFVSCLIGDLQAVVLDTKDLASLDPKRIASVWSRKRDAREAALALAQDLLGGDHLPTPRPSSRPSSPSPPPN